MEEVVQKLKNDSPRKQKKKLIVNMYNTSYDVVEQASMELGFNVSYDEESQNASLIWMDCSIQTE